MRLFLFLFPVLILGCSKEENCSTPPAPTPIRLINANGEDLLNPQNPNAYPLSAIQLSYQENGIVKYDQLSLSSISGTDTFFLLNSMPWNAQNGQTFYLRLTSTDTDTIYMRNDAVDENGCTFYQLSAFQYNGVEIAPTSFPGGPRAFQIVK